MKVLVIDGVRYKLWTPKDEEKEFHPMVKEHSKEIFGEDSVYFDIKHKLTSKSGIATIPDAYVITLSKPYEWYVVENELSSHPIYDHIVKQLTKFMNGLRNPESRNKVLEAIDEEIRSDKVLEAYVRKKTGSEDYYRFLSKLLSHSFPKIVVVIDELSEEVKEACQSLKYETQFVEFKTFVRENAPNIYAHLFEPLYGKDMVTKEIDTAIEEKIEKIESEEIKDLLRESLDQLKQRNCIIKPLKGRWMSVYIKGKRFMYIAVRKKWFICQIKKIDGEWTDTLRLKSTKDWENVFKKYIQPILL